MSVGPTRDNSPPADRTRIRPALPDQKKIPRWVAEFWSGHWSRAEPLWHLAYRLPLVWAALALVLGIVVSRWATLACEFWLLAAVGSVGVAVVCGWANRLGLSTAAGLLAMFLFGAGHATGQRPGKADSLSPFASRMAKPIALNAVVESAASWRPNPNYRPGEPRSERWRTRWDVRVQRVRTDARWVPAHSRTTLTVDGRTEGLLPGDRVEIFGQYRLAGKATNPGGFDMAERMLLDGMYLSLEVGHESQLRVLGVDASYRFTRWRAIAVRQVDRWLRRWVTGDQATLAAALVLGQREQVDWQNQQELMATGTLHLLAISGLHVEMVAVAIVLLCGLLGVGNRLTFVLLVICCGGYGVLAGGKPPVLRAILIVAAMALARVIGRDARMGNVLAAAAIGLLFWRVVHLERLGVQLSFLAVTAIAVFVVRKPVLGAKSNGLEKLLEGSQNIVVRSGRSCLVWAASGLRLSVWVWLVTCPMIWTHFHVVAPIAIPLNVVIAIPLVISLLSGLATAAVGSLPPIAAVTGAFCGSGLNVVTWLIHQGSRVPLGHWWLPAPSRLWVVAFYVILCGWLLVFGRTKLWWLALLLGLMILGGVADKCTGVRGYLTGRSYAQVGMADREKQIPGSVRDEHAVNDRSGMLHVTFLDVGHGTSVLIEMPTGEVWLYDAGQMGSADRSYEEIAGALWRLPTARIDTLVVSHADSDHYNAVSGLLKRFRVGRIASTPQFWQSEDVPVQQLIAEVENAPVVMQRWSAGRDGVVGQVAWRVLHPGARWAGGSDNANSLCLLLEYAGRRILLPGDLEGPGLVGLVEMPPRGCDILMAPHHGSATLDPRELLRWCRPKWTVISGNHRAMRPRVIGQYRGLTDKLGITFRDGAIQFRIASDGTLEAFHYVEGDWLPIVAK